MWKVLSRWVTFHSSPERKEFNFVYSKQFTVQIQVHEIIRIPPVDAGPL